MTLKIYGIKTCDTVRKARKWLEAEGIGHTFHDFREDGIEEGTLSAWASELGWEVLVNKRGTTFRKLDEAEKQVGNADQAVKLMAAYPAIIKRPVFDTGGKRLVGFTDAVKGELSALTG
ncbi:MAG: ArsC family reductase [Alphaproteobacteria bacterium]|nr:ArsC family reductase [Alphaproteobacteria bacterium]